MVTVNMHEAKTHLSRLVERVEAGEEVVIARAGKPVARLMPAKERDMTPRPLGTMRGQFEIPDDFDDPLPIEDLALWYGVPVEEARVKFAAEYEPKEWPKDRKARRSRVASRALEAPG